MVNLKTMAWQCLVAVHNKSHWILIKYQPDTRGFPGDPVNLLQWLGEKILKALICSCICKGEPCF